jgi:hypothetical protein
MVVVMPTRFSHILIVFLLLFPIKRGFTIETFPAATVSLFSPGRLFFSFQLGKGRAMALAEVPS